MNPELLLGLTKQKILQIINDSGLPMGTIALLMESITREAQKAANLAFEQAYAAAQEEGKVHPNSQDNENE